jgi:hypothetical protein
MEKNQNRWLWYQLLATQLGLSTDNSIQYKEEERIGGRRTINSGTGKGKVIVLKICLMPLLGLIWFLL